ncbi:MAG: O-antigen ligase family protein [Candidatus Levybacteria bacterium]|nr:O-antigen ligase family protein [Candidatus Levybacteria bacterium]
MQIILPILLFFLLVLEGLGVKFGREATLFLIIFLFPILFVHMFFHKKSIVFPKMISVFFLLFIVSTLISTVISVNVTQSIQYLLLTISLFLVFLLSYNYKGELKKPITIFIFASSILFSLYSLCLNLNFLNFFIPENGYQFVFSRFASHNHLGDFLALPIIICIYYLYNRTGKQVSILKASINLKSLIINQNSNSIFLSVTYLLVATPFVIFSYSRSSYLTIALCTLFIHIFYIKNKHSAVHKMTSRLLIMIIVLSTIFFFITTTQQAERQPLASRINNLLVQKTGLKYKDILGERPEYVRQSLLSAQKNPIFGIGPDNFQSASKQYSKPSVRVTTSAHNIFLEILVGQGILGLLPFVGLILVILIKSRKNALFFAMLAMLINFQTDYTYQISSFMLLFFALAGIILKGHQEQ